MTHTEDLRAWAKGSHTTVAATELLIRALGGWAAAPGNPWVHASTTTPEGYIEGAWIDFEAIPENVGTLSGGERRVLMIAASIAENVPVVLGDVIPGLDRNNLNLVLAALAHAGGSHEHSDIRMNADGSMSIGGGYLDTLHPWPEEDK